VAGIARTVGRTAAAQIEPPSTHPWASIGSAGNVCVAQAVVDRDGLVAAVDHGGTDLRDGPGGCFCLTARQRRPTRGAAKAGRPPPTYRSVL